MKTRYWIVLAILLAALDLSAQTDSLGIYAVTDSGIEYMRLTRSEGTKISANPFGGKAKLVFNGEHSAIIFNKGHVKFKMYFGNPSADQIRDLYMFPPSGFPSDFAIYELKAKKGKRYMTVAKVRVFGSLDIGGQGPSDIVINKSGGNSYEISADLPPGEYCIAPRSGGTGYGGVFDFSVK